MPALKRSAKAMHDELVALGDAAIARHSMRFFKAGPGEYGEGDRFLGIRVPVLRAQVKKYRGVPLKAVLSLLKSKWHEERLFAVLLLVQEYSRGSEEQKNAIYDAYLAQRQYVNNWDIVDSSAHLIVGPHLDDAKRDVLYELAESEGLWDRRIAMMSTYHFIRQKDFKDALRIAHLLRNDEHDLIHKVVGWMLREIGNRDREAEEKFLLKHYKKMPRTMLRYAIEKFPETRRKAYLNGSI
jgi:3-methyladenine DNA glycosylase AlkD